MRKTRFSPSDRRSEWILDINITITMSRRQVRKIKSSSCLCVTCPMSATLIFFVVNVIVINVYIHKKKKKIWSDYSFWFSGSSAEAKKKLYANIFLVVTSTVDAFIRVSE